jgi:hypothetical protein
LKGLLLAHFDYNAPAEVYAGRSMRGARTMMYQRFDTGAEALRFAIEIMPPPNLKGAILETGERRYWHGEIQKLYDAPGYPFTRKPKAEISAISKPQRK